MRRLLTVVAFSLLAQPALAQSLSPMQQYLQNESGYVPQPVAPQPQQVQAPVPYNMAQSPSAYAAPQPSPSVSDNSRINSGVAAMNN